MKQKCQKYIIAGIPFLIAPFSALAEPSDRPKPSFGIDLFLTILPFVLAGIFIYFMFLKKSGPRLKEYEAYRARHELHMERVEQSLEQIVKALEKRE
jgi:hypothetical protein